MPGANQYRASDFIDVINGTAGIISTIAARVGCAWHTAKKYIEMHPTVKAAYDAECERVLDAAESVVIGEIVEKKDVQTSKWYLQMKGAERGYAPKQQVEHKGEMTVTYKGNTDPTKLVGDDP